jgi:sigma-B regulation protein RsbU (phosphoserine phosphatase)
MPDAPESHPAMHPPTASIAPGNPVGVPIPDPDALSTHSVREFLTDGSLASVCDELSRTTGVPIWLRDRDFGAIIPGRGHSPWEIVDEVTARRRAGELAGASPNEEAELFAAPLRLSSGVIGAIVMAVPTAVVDERVVVTGEGGELRVLIRSLETALRRLASAISEGCEAQLALKSRVQELGALYRLSSLLVQTGDSDRVLSVALDLAMQVLRADAGSIALLPENPPTGPSGVDQLSLPMDIRAARGLSREWIEDTRPLSAGGILRAAALEGDVIAVEDLAADPRVNDPARVRSEGLVSFITTGLMYHGRPVGLVRLYTRTPRRFTRGEQGLLRSIADQSAASVVNARLRVLREQNEQVRRQVQLAADVQRRMLPRSTPDVPPLELAARYVPSFELGGDFYDFIRLDSNLGIVVGDVVGKGVAAALLMSAVRASLRAHAQDVYQIGEVLVRVNQALVRDTLDNEFATLWYGVIDPATLRMTYCGAGHEWPMLFRAPPVSSGKKMGADDVLRLTADGMALGIDPQQKYPFGIFDLKKGDVLAIYTDGLTDASDFNGKRFGGTRIKKAIVELLAEDPHASAQRVVDHVAWHIRQFIGMNTPPDDMTMVVLRVK